MRLARLLTLAAVGLTLSAGDALAGPIHDRAQQRREARQERCGQVAGPVAFRPAPPPPVAVARPVTVGSCPGGVCPAPAFRR